jgi:hypothetical protein
MKNEIPEIKEVARLMPCPENTNYSTISYIDEKEETISFHEEYAFYAVASMLRIFDFLLLAGDTSALENPYTVIISSSTAARYFGEVLNDLLGETLYIPYLGEEKAQYKLTGVFQDLPQNSHLQADVLMSFSTLTAHDPHFYEDCRLDLSASERRAFFDSKINPLLMGMMEKGAEILGCAVNDNTGNERMDYQFMAVWKLPNKAFSDQLEEAAKKAGFLDYFDQFNFIGTLIPLPVLNESIVNVRLSRKEVQRKTTAHRSSCHKAYM